MQSRCFTELWPISSRWTCKFKSIPPTLGHLHFWTGHFTYCFTHCGTIEKKTGYQDQLKHILVCVLPLFLMNYQRHGVLLGTIWAGFLHPLALKKRVGFFYLGEVPSATPPTKQKLHWRIYSDPTDPSQQLLYQSTMTPQIYVYWSSNIHKENEQILPYFTRPEANESGMNTDFQRGRTTKHSYSILILIFLWPFQETVIILKD